jgi:hypothetical protein
MRLKTVLWTAPVFLLLLLCIGITFTVGWRPIIGPRARPVTDRKFDSTPTRLEHGSYLVNSLYGCIQCHSEPDHNLPGWPAVVGREGAGRLFDKDADIGTVYAPNITPDPETGIGKWTDDEIARAVREGIDKDGRALFPIMPYPNFRQMSDEDLASVVVYIRALKPVKNAVPRSEINFPISRLILGVPEPVTEPVRDPKFATPRDRGEYLVRMASCADCHTPVDGNGQPIAGMEFAGGMAISEPGGKPVTSLNITPDVSSGIPYYDENTFITTFRSGRIGARQLNPVMPWGVYRNLTDDDLKSIYAFIHTLKPVVHHVDNVAPPTVCPICGGTHGLGDSNKKK